jgi:hypothetical protein
MKTYLFQGFKAYRGINDYGSTFELMLELNNDDEACKKMQELVKENRARADILDYRIYQVYEVRNVLTNY